MVHNSFLSGMAVEYLAFVRILVALGSALGLDRITAVGIVVVGDGIEPQVAVLAYQFGDGFTNMIIPTSAVLMGILGLAGIAYIHWFRFILPLIVKLTVASAVALVVAIWIGYQ